MHTIIFITNGRRKHQLVSHCKEVREQFAQYIFAIWLDMTYCVQGDDPHLYFKAKTSGFSVPVTSQCKFSMDLKFIVILRTLMAYRKTLIFFHSFMYNIKCEMNLGRTMPENPLQILLSSFRNLWSLNFCRSKVLLNWFHGDWLFLLLISIIFCIITLESSRFTLK